MRKKTTRESNLNTILKKQKNRVACNPDLGPAVVLGAPRGAFLGLFSACGSIK
jgi:hypothetical protein